MALRDTLTGIQRGTFADKHGWMTRLGWTGISYHHLLEAARLAGQRNPADAAAADRH